MSNRKHKPTKANSRVIRNIPAFVSSYLKSASGRDVLNRKPYRAVLPNGKTTVVMRSSQMADAFQRGLDNLKRA